MRLLGYIRVSTDEQAKEGQSLGVQDLQLHRYADLYGHELIDVIVDDGVSASVPLEKRQGGRELVDRLRDREADGFVVQRLDRAFRITVDGLVTADQFRKVDQTIHSVNEHIDTTTPMGWYFLTLILANAQLERDRIRERATEVSHGLREQGKAWGPTPYGCMRIGDNLFRDPATWGTREMIVRLAGTISMRAICAELEDNKIPAPSGGRFWHASTVKGILASHDDLKHIPWPEGHNETRVSPMEVVK